MRSIAVALLAVALPAHAYIVPYPTEGEFSSYTTINFDTPVSPARFDLPPAEVLFANPVRIIGLSHPAMTRTATPAYTVVTAFLNGVQVGQELLPDWNGCVAPGGLGDGCNPLQTRRRDGVAFDSMFDTVTIGGTDGRGLVTYSGAFWRAQEIVGAIHTPEPSTYALLGLGLLALVSVGRRSAIV